MSNNLHSELIKKLIESSEVINKSSRIGKSDYAVMSAEVSEILHKSLYPNEYRNRAIDIILKDMCLPCEYKITKYKM